MKQDIPEVSLKYLFEPDSIAIIGASREPGKVGYSIVNNLKNSNYSGSIRPVNPKADEILGYDCYSSVSEIPEQVDIALIAVPAKIVPDVVEEAGKSGVKFAVITSSGFSEIGNIEEENEVVNIAHEHGMRVLGPNIFGVYYGPKSMNATFGPSDIEPGNIALISQSGALGNALIEKTVMEEIGLSAIASVGNKADITEVELLKYLKDDSNTKAIVIYLEGTERGRELMEIARKVVKKKPIIVIKAGRSSKGAKAAASHTGSLAGSDKIFEAAFKQSGILRAKSANQAFNWAKTAANQPLPEGKEAVIVTNGGGVGVLATDACEDHGLKLYNDQEQLAEIYDEVVPDYGSTKNPVDMTGMADVDFYSRAIETTLTSDKIDSLILLYCITEGQDPPKFAETFKKAIRDQDNKKPVTISILGGSGAQKGRSILNKSGLPAFEEPEDAVESLSVLYRWKDKKENLTYFPSEPLDVDWKKIKGIIKDARSQGRLELLETEAKTILKTLNVPVADFRTATSEKECLQAAEEIGYPVALKIESEAITHKTEAGGVQLDLSSPEEVSSAYNQIISSSKKYKPEANIRRVSINEMVSGELEVIVGSSKDPSFGPTIMFGLGGIYVEVLKDVAFRVAPVDRIEARNLVGEINAYPLLLGVRGQARKDIESLTDIIYKISRMVDEIRDIVELDINPLKAMEDGNGCKVLDCSMTISEVEE